jgi:hypothetical protein
MVDGALTQKDNSKRTLTFVEVTHRQAVKN